MKKILSLFFFILFFLNVPVVFAQEYIMPYPSYMPGNKLYKLHSFWEKIEEYWYFGDMAQVKYHQHQSDKYLVEARTLFEYGQTALGVLALSKSNDHFAKAVLYQMDVTHEKKDDGQQKGQLINAGQKHSEILGELKEKLPEEVEWKEEKEESKKFPIALMLKEAILLRTYANK